MPADSAMRPAEQAMPQRLIAYFRDCLLADARGRDTVDVLGRNERLQAFLPVPGLDGETATTIALDAEYAKSVLATLELQRNERELAFGVGLVIAPYPGGNARIQHLRAPLWLFDASIDNGVVPTLRFDPASRRINPLVAEALGLDPASADLQASTRLFEILNQFEEIPASASSRAYPRWRDGQPVRWSNVGVAWVTARSRLGATVAAELAQLATETRLSAPLRQILGHPVKAQSSGHSQPNALPAGLTHAQSRALRNAARYTLSVINGPPGTGKTYTLACQAIDRAMQGDSVLVVCGNDHAADVVHGQLGGMLADARHLLVRAGRGGYRQQLLDRLESLLADGARAPVPENAQPSPFEDAETLANDEQLFHRHCSIAERDGDVLLFNRTIDRLKGWFIRRRIGRQPLLLERWQALHARRTLQRQRVSAYLLQLANARIADIVAKRRHELSQLSSALRARSSGTRQQRFDSLDWSALASTFPIWVVSAQELSHAVPLSAELFDLVVIDEATQCSLPLALPALQRGKRAVIVGDPRQLRHYSFLSRRIQDDLVQQHGVGSARISLDYRDRSTLDFALAAVTGPDAIAQLDEHFRSHPHLIAFSNREFYGSALKILTRARPDDPPPFRLVECEIDRDGDINTAEIEAVIACLDEHVAQFVDVPDSECPSIGVMGLFRATALQLESAVIARFSLATISRHAIRVGTPYAFQGEERDIVLIASGLFPGRAAAAWAYLDRADVVNVAVTRARRQQVVFIGKGALDGREHSLVARYLAASAKPASSEPVVPVVTASTMKRDLQASVKAWGFEVAIDAPFAGEQLDLAALRAGRVVAFDVVGDRSATSAAWSPARYRQLERAGIEVVPVAWSEWQLHQERTAHAIRTIVAPHLDATGPAWSFADSPLRARLIALDATTFVDRLDALDRHHAAVRQLIGERFDPGELTHARYAASVDRLHQAAIHEIDGAARILESLRDLELDTQSESLRSALESRAAGSQQALSAILQLAEQLTLLQTSPSHLDSAIDEINALAERVPRYGVPATGQPPMMLEADD